MSGSYVISGVVIFVWNFCSHQIFQFLKLGVLGDEKNVGPFLILLLKAIN